MGSWRYLASHSLWELAQRWIAVGPSQPETTPATQIMMMSMRRCLRFFVTVHDICKSDGAACPTALDAKVCVR